MDTDTDYSVYSCISSTINVEEELTTKDTFNAVPSLCIVVGEGHFLPLPLTANTHKTACAFPRFYLIILWRVFCRCDCDVIKLVSKECVRIVAAGVDTCTDAVAQSTVAVTFA